MHIDESMEMRKHIDDFNKVILDIKNINVKIKEDDRAILLLSSLPKTYKHFMDTILYGKETLTMTKVKATLKSKKL